MHVLKLCIHFLRDDHLNYYIVKLHLQLVPLNINLRACGFVRSNLVCQNAYIYYQMPYTFEFKHLGNQKLLCEWR
jgi:hypothetical protein